MNKLGPFQGAALFLVTVAFLAVLVAAFGGCNDGRHHGANIPIDVDPCMIEGVEDCAPECEVCEVCEVCPTPLPPICLTWEWVKVCEDPACPWTCHREKRVVEVDCPLEVGREER